MMGTTPEVELDSRGKILAEITNFQRPVLLVTGRFDILREDVTRRIAEARERIGARTVIVEILPMEGTFLPPARRAEMAAALRVVDYVLLSPSELQADE